MNNIIAGGGIGMGLALSLHNVGFQDLDICEPAPEVRESKAP